MPIYLNIHEEQMQDKTHPIFFNPEKMKWEASKIGVDKLKDAFNELNKNKRRKYIKLNTDE